MTKKKKDKKLSEKQRLAKELDDIVLSNISKKVAATLLSSKSYSEYLKKVQAKKRLIHLKPLITYLKTY